MKKYGKGVRYWTPFLPFMIPQNHKVRSMCIKCVVIKMECYKCKGLSIRHGKSRNGEQRYFCKTCLLSFQENFIYNAYKVRDKQIILLTKEGLGIRSTSRVLDISPATVLRRILKISKSIIRPYPILKGKSYEVDELVTFIGIQRRKNLHCVFL